MKKIFLLLSLISVVFFGCKKEEDNNDDVDIITDYREKYVGTYLITDSVFINTNTFHSTNQYNLVVSIDPNTANQIILKYIWNTGEQCYAVIQNDIFSIYAQPFAGNDVITGTGSIINGVLKYNTTGYQWVRTGIGSK